METFEDITNTDILMMATTFCGNYNEWNKYDDVMKVLNMETNSFCKSLKLKYPLSDDKIIQSISLAYHVALFMICNKPVNLQED